MDTFSSAIKEQLSFNEKLELQIARMFVVLLVSTNHDLVNEITTRGGRSIKDPPYAKGMSRRTKVVPVIQEEEKEVRSSNEWQKNNIFMSLGWTIRYQKCVELVECFQLHYSYALFGVWVKAI